MKKKNGGKDIRMQSLNFFDHVYIIHFQEINFAYQNRDSNMHIYVIVIITLFQLPVPHFDNERRVFAVVDDPERQGLDALLGAAQLRQLLLQSRLGEGRHAAVCARFSLWTRMSSDLV